MSPRAPDIIYVVYYLLELFWYMDIRGKTVSDKHDWRLKEDHIACTKW